MLITKDMIDRATQPPPPAEHAEHDGGGDGEDLQIIIMTTIHHEGVDAGFTSRVAAPLDTPPAGLVGMLLSAARGAASAYSITLHSMLVDQLGGHGAPLPGLTVSLLDQLAEHHRQHHPGQPVMVAVNGLAEPVPYELARAVLAAAGAW